MSLTNNGPTLPAVGTHFTYKRWNSYLSGAYPVEVFEGVVASSAIDSIGDSVVTAYNFEGSAKTFWNSSWDNPGALESIEIHGIGVPVQS